MFTGEIEINSKQASEILKREVFFGIGDNYFVKKGQKCCYSIFDLIKGVAMIAGNTKENTIKVLKFHEKIYSAITEKTHN